jgi:hypothetical protein
MELAIRIYGPHDKGRVSHGSCMEQLAARGSCMQWPWCLLQFTCIFTVARPERYHRKVLVWSAFTQPFLAKGSATHLPV